MLKQPNILKQSKRLDSGEMMQYMELSRLGYADLKADFKTAAHLAEIDQTDLRGAGGVLIKCTCQADGLMAAAYLYRKYEAQCPDKEAAGQDEADFCEKYMDELWEEDEEAGDEENFFVEEGKMIRLPVITEQEFLQAYTPYAPFPRGMFPLQNRWDEDKKEQKPYWAAGDYPLVVEGFNFAGQRHNEWNWGGRFILFVHVVPKESPAPWFGGAHSHFEKSFLFETNIEACSIGIPAMEYYEEALSTAVYNRGFRLSKSVDRLKLIKELIDYRGMFFQSAADIEKLTGKAIHKKHGLSKTMTKADFEKVVSVTKEKAVRQPAELLTAEQELEQMIGMAGVKQQLKRAIQRMRMNKQRRDNGYRVSGAHLAACFLGNPGTNKTTAARLFGRMLREANVLSSDAFVEVSRKDLVGQFVGWTAPTVARVFEQAKGGTLFIDEAYSLMSEGLKDGYSEEALSEIIRQMENNPDTLVIFAGYPDKMRMFVQHANPGLRSRLTNLIEFKDYNPEEMWRIFQYFVRKEEFELEDEAQAEAAIRALLAGMNRGVTDNTGNGRLMRKLFHTSIGYMAERERHDLRTIETADIAHAVQELLEQEAFMLEGGKRPPQKIGFA